MLDDVHDRGVAAAATGPATLSESDCSLPASAMARSGCMCRMPVGAAGFSATGVPVSLVIVTVAGGATAGSARAAASAAAAVMAMLLVFMGGHPEPSRADPHEPEGSTSA